MLIDTSSDFDYEKLVTMMRNKEKSQPSSIKLGGFFISKIRKGTQNEFL